MKSALILTFACIALMLSLTACSSSNGGGQSQPTASQPSPPPGPAPDNLPPLPAWADPKNDCRINESCKNQVEQISDFDLQRVFEKVRADFIESAQTNPETAQTPQQRELMGSQILLGALQSIANLDFKNDPSNQNGTIQSITKLQSLFFDENGEPLDSVDPGTIHKTLCKENL